MLFVSAWILRRHPRFWRVLTAAGVGGLYALLTLYIPSNLLPPLSILCALGMVLLTFGYRDLKSFLSPVLTFYLISALMGGITESLLSSFKRILPPLESLLLLTAALSLSAGITFFAGRAFLRRCAARNAEISFCLNGVRYRIPAFCDSGNLITDPDSGLPVIFLSASLFSQTPQSEKMLTATTVAGTATFPLFLPKDLTVNDEKRAALLAITENKSFEGQPALIPNILLT